MGSLPDSRWHSDRLQQADTRVGAAEAARGVAHRSSLIVQPAADRSAEASESSNACSHFEMAQALDLEDAAEKTFFFPCFSTVRSRA